VAEDKLLWIKETILGPLVVATILATMGLGGGAWLYADDLGDNLDREIYRSEQLERRLADLEQEFVEFRKPGGRFTAKDGAHLHEAINAANRRLDMVDKECQRCREKVGRIETQIEYFHRGN